VECQHWRELSRVEIGRAVESKSSPPHSGNIARIAEAAREVPHGAARVEASVARHVSICSTTPADLESSFRPVHKAFVEPSVANPDERHEFASSQLVCPAS
jgi:hypothetical protein